MFVGVVIYFKLKELIITTSALQTTKQIYLLIYYFVIYFILDQHANDGFYSTYLYKINFNFNYFVAIINSSSK